MATPTCQTCVTRNVTGKRIFDPISCSACLDAYDKLTDELGGQVDRRRFARVAERYSRRKR